jgi:hypothetical protein
MLPQFLVLRVLSSSLSLRADGGVYAVNNPVQIFYRNKLDNYTFKY